VNRNVWIVFSNVDNVIYFDGAFSSKEKAEEFIDMQREAHKEFMYIEEQELDVMDVA
jgi:hypothetical protein